MVSKGWLDRYRNGDRTALWHDLRQVGSLHGDERDEAQLVCDEMADRARQNIEEIVDRLTSQGYRFHTNDFAQQSVVPHYPPGGRMQDCLDWLDDRIGPVPLTLTSWLRRVGDVWLVGTHPEWPESAAADPLVFEIEGVRYPDTPIVEHFESELEAYAQSDDDDQFDMFVLPVAPDHLHKANISGGSPYGFVLPDETAEGMFAGDAMQPFVAYLNRVFAHGGFPRPDASDAGWRVRQSLAQGLLPL